MKVAMFHNLPPGGALRVFYEQKKYLSRYHTVVVYKLAQKKKNLHALPYISRIKKDYYDFVTLRMMHKELADEISKRNYDIAFVHPDMYTQAPYVLRYLQVPSIYFCHELLRISYEKIFAIPNNTSVLKRMYEKINRLIRKAIDRKNAQAATYIIANSIFTKHKVKAAYQRESDICYPGVDSTVFKPENKKENYVLFLGNPEIVNGYDLLQQATDRLYQMNITIMHVPIVSSKLLSDRDLAKKYARAIATLCLSYAEPFGLVALESMACGTPVIAVKEGGYKETVIDKKTGFLISRDSSQLANSIATLARNPQLALRLGRAGREHVKKQWTWDVHGMALEKIIKRIANIQ